MKRQQMSSILDRELDERNYLEEAKIMIKPLGSNQLYELYEIANSMLKKNVSEAREKELRAVVEAVERHSPRKLDVYRLRKLRDGFHSEMANTANPKHGNTKKSPKRV